LYIILINQSNKIEFGIYRKSTTTNLLTSYTKAHATHLNNSPQLCLLLKENGMNTAGTLRLNSNDVPDTLKQAKLKKAELVAYQSECYGFEMDREEANDLHFNVHDATMVSEEKTGKVISKSKCIR
jgi:hypothetical protein